MRIAAKILLIVGLALFARAEDEQGHVQNPEEDGLFDCVFAESTTGCLRTRLARDIDRIEVQVAGKKNEPPISMIIEQAGNLMAEVVDDLQHPEKESEVEEDSQQVEARKKKLGKKKKKHLQKLLGLLMLFKAKISLLLQLISTHFQLKFFVIAVISLILNATKFWLDLKKSHHPSKVIYYEQAHHQHHYDHDDHDHSGYWGRSSNDSPQELAYSAYVPEQ